MIFGKKKAEAEQRDKIIRFKRVFGGEEGKSVLFDILNIANVLETHKGDPFKEGRRSLALDILHFCKVDLAKFDELLKGDGNS